VAPRRLRRAATTSVLLAALMLQVQAAAQGWTCPVCGQIRHGGTEASLRVHICSAHPATAGCPGARARANPAQPAPIVNGIIGVIGGLLSTLSSRGINEPHFRELSPSVIQRQYIEEANRRAAEEAERARQRRREAFERGRREVLQNMRGRAVSGGELEMRGRRTAGELEFRETRSSSRVLSMPAAVVRRVDQLSQTVAVTEDMVRRVEETTSTTSTYTPEPLPDDLWETLKEETRARQRQWLATQITRRLPEEWVTELRNAARAWMQLPNANTNPAREQLDRFRARAIGELQWRAKTSATPYAERALIYEFQTPQHFEKRVLPALLSLGADPSVAR